MTSSLTQITIIGMAIGVLGLICLKRRDILVKLALLFFALLSRYAVAPAVGIAMFYAVLILLNVRYLQTFHDVVILAREPTNDQAGKWLYAAIAGWFGAMFFSVGLFKRAQKPCDEETGERRDWRGRIIITHRQAKNRLVPNEPPKNRLLAALERALSHFSKKTKSRPLQLQARDAARQRTPADSLTLWWGMINLPLVEAAGHFMVVGAPGSGKTITIRLLMQSVLPKVVKASNMRALVFDSKRDMLPILAGFLPNNKYKIKVLNPFDRRSVPWDMAADITSPSAADAVAAIFIPAESNSANRFFSDAAQQLLAGVLRTFINTCPGDWTLRDVVLAMRTPRRLKTVLSEDLRNQHLVETYLSDREERTAQNIISTVASKIQAFEVVAAMWEHSNWAEKISLSNWVKEESILVLGCHPARKASLDPLNQAMFHRLSELLLSGPETSPGKTWLFMDELRELGKFEGLTSLLNQGRSKGVSVVIGFQSIEGLIQVYGREGADEIASQCTNKTFLRTDSHTTAKWAEEHFGQAEHMEVNYSHSESYSKDPSSSESWSYQRVVRTTVMASELMEIPKTGERHGFSGIHNIPLVGSYPTKTDWKELRDLLAPEEPTIEPPEQDREKAEEYISDWKDRDVDRLKLPRSVLTNPARSGVNPLD